MTARCTTRGCPTRYRSGDDRPCPMHAQDETSLLGRMEQFGALAQAAPGDRDDDERTAP